MLCCVVLYNTVSNLHASSHPLPLCLFIEILEALGYLVPFYFMCWPGALIRPPHPTLCTVQDEDR